MSKPTHSDFTVFPHGPGQPTDALTGLANNQARGLGVPAALSGHDVKDWKVGCVKITTGTIPGSPHGTGTAALYLATSEDGVLFTDFLDPNSLDGEAQYNLLMAGQSIARNLVQQLSCSVSGTAYCFEGFSVLQRIGYVPGFFGLYVLNTTGAAFSVNPVGFAAGYRQIDFSW